MMGASPGIQTVDKELTEMGYTTPESKLQALHPIFKKYI